MSKELESLENMYEWAIDTWNENTTTYKELTEDYELLQQALTELEELKKRDTAMKPVEAMITWQCGECGKEIRNTFNSCPYCRTRIDWSSVYGEV